MLWRMDLADHLANVFIVSPRMPDLTSLAEQGGWPLLPETKITRPYAPLLSRIESGHRYAFRLTANPTRSRAETGADRGKVYGHVTVAQQEEWLLSRQERAGFRIWSSGDETAQTRDMVVSGRRTVSFSRRETRVTLRIATFEGTLVVTDPELFVHALSHGIGRAKGYGCGLMTIAPVR